MSKTDNRDITTFGGLSMSMPKILDTSALINWPIDSLDGGFVVNGQRSEIERVAPERMLSIETARMNWVSPSPESVQESTVIARKTGDIDGLSETDLHLFALAIELGGHMHTDDYRLQNLCNSVGVEWSPVVSEGISEVWNWEIRCMGCGALASGTGNTRPASEEIGSCAECGSGLRVVKKK